MSLDQRWPYAVNALESKESLVSYLLRMDGEIQQSENMVLEFQRFKAIFAFIQVDM